MAPIMNAMGDNILFCLISGAALLIVPGSLLWWVIAQIVNADRREAGLQRVVGRWHPLRFGPTAPLLSLIAALGGAAPVIVAGPYAMPASITLPCIALAFLGLVSFLMSVLLWFHASDPAESAGRRAPRRTG